MNKTQFWKNGVMMSLVTTEEAQEIIANAEAAGLKVYKSSMPNHFEVIA